jgi:acetyl-CoA synthetase
LSFSGYRLEAAEIENVLISHSAVTEAGVIGLPYDIKGNGIYAYVILKADIIKHENLT